jgi:hypothetical protein
MATIPVDVTLNAEFFRGRLGVNKLLKLIFNRSESYKFISCNVKVTTFLNGSFKISVNSAMIG